MRRRLYFILPDPQLLSRIVAELKGAGIDAGAFQFSDDFGYELWIGQNEIKTTTHDTLLAEQ